MIINDTGIKNSARNMKGMLNSIFPCCDFIFTKDRYLPSGAPQSPLLHVEVLSSHS